MPAWFERPGLSGAYRRVYMAANYRLRTLWGGRWADRCRPTDIGFLMTNLCNAKCVHCDIWKNKGKDDTPTVDQYKATLNDIRSWLGPVHVFFSGGEALLRPYTPEVLAHAASIGLFAEILTHGYWDDQSRIEKAALANPSRITVSLDGIGDTHTLIRGRENFFEKTNRTSSEREQRSHQAQAGANAISPTPAPTHRRSIHAFSVGGSRFERSRSSVLRGISVLPGMRPALGMSAYFCGFGNALRLLGGALQLRRGSALGCGRPSSGTVNPVRDRVGLHRGMG